MPPSITYDGAATISTGGGNGSGSGVKLKLKLKLKRGQSPPSQGSGQGSRSCQGSRSRSGSESFKSIHRIIHCPRRNTTYEGYILAASQSSSSSNSSSKGRRKKKHHDLYQAQSQAQDTGTDVSLALAPSAPSPAPVMDYIKHGKGVLHDHTNHTILSGYFQHDVVIGHALQTIYDNSGRYALAQYEGTFRTNAGDGAGDVDDPVSDCGGGGGGGLLLRHGKGKIAWHGTNDMYYGEFHNGIMQGMGTFTWGANGDRYEGPFAKGRMHTSTHASGHGHGHGGGGDCPPGKMVTMGRHGRGGEDVFVGGWRKGLMHGWGRKCFGNGDLFCGYYHRDVRQGYGSYHWQNGDVYVGAWDDGRFCNKSRGRGVKALVKMKTIEMDANTDADALPANGNGNGNDDANDNDNDEETTLSRRSDITEVYHGEWCGDVAHGNGMKQYSNGDYYLGEFIDDMRHGYGIYKWSNGDVYEGEFVDGLCTGLGLKRMVVVSDDDGNDGNDTADVDIDVYDGEWVEDKANGYGVKTFGATGDIHMGQYQNDERHGHGLYRWAANGNEYEGDFREGEQTGFGTFRRMNTSTRLMTDLNAPMNTDEDVDTTFSNTNTSTHGNGLVYSGKWKDGRKNGPGFLRVRAHVEVGGILHSVEKLYFDLYVRGTRVSRQHFDIAMDMDGTRNSNADKNDVNVGLSSWDDADMEACLEQLRAKQMCWRELRREHFKPHT
eukprot:CAMPEP_0194100316 /NCGR_PEP_ID=MMETSP0150-20130528/1213_1 /TAXON_ID=122233 /ORGANISM="Chaetoceros debilis, Strain MM31A-1" /LENGTH=716 /DNA_ID=CAMNT_0038786661 /DNA_START=340 /DNA_END=2490 /DNA_ORIENTATION=-